MNNLSPISFEEIEINKNVVVYAINIEKLTDELCEFIDEKLISICRGKRNLNLATVKKDFINYLDKKNTSNLLTGAVSEFFAHLFLNYKEFKQECLYFNLESNDIKKGFDGYYSLEDVEWIMESKSSTNPTKSHKEIVKIGYDGIKSKIETIDSENNPWENAYNHAKVIGSNESLLDKLNKLSENYSNGLYGDITEHNIILSSTLFLKEHYSPNNTELIKHDITSYLSNQKYKSALILCLNKKSRQQLKEYLKK